jgi:lactate dehydrogenase-like 2-hydroxyacid dehydrogenase
LFPPQLGIEDYLKSEGHELVVTDDKEGANSEFQSELKTADVLITTPFHPAYLTKELLAEEKSPNLKLCVTAGVGSDHVDLDAANLRKITVAEVSIISPAPLF